jgi:predicted small lipoprotein YifL
MNPRSLLLLLPVLLFAACGKTGPTAAPAAAKAGHEHKAPHGGTAIELGEEAFHLELVKEENGKLSAYVLDGELENFIRIASPSFQIVALAGGESRTLEFRAVASTATGETVGSTSHFEAEADWLKTTPTFGGLLTRLEIRGTVFTAVAFNFPQGNEK